MQNWQKNRNYRKHENTDGSFTYIITIDGENVEVRKEVYEVYAQADRRERYCAERDAGRLLSMEQLEEDGISLDKYVESAEDTVVRMLLAEQAMAALKTLEPDEQHLIQALIIDGMTERAYAASTGFSQKSVNKRKHKILEKLRALVLKSPEFREV